MQWAFKYRDTFDHEIDSGFAIFPVLCRLFHDLLGMWSELSVWTSRFGMIAVLILTWKYFVLLETSLNHMMIQIQASHTQCALVWPSRKVGD